jgi:isoquinoline 1-oxidoreductase subunit alpha
MIQLTVNGSGRQSDGDPAMPLLWYLRDLLELTSAKIRLRHGLVLRLHGARGRKASA